MVEMTDNINKKVIVAGAGLTGCLCALILQKQGFDVTIYERWGDIRNLADTEIGGRSINLVLTARGIAALNLPVLDGLKEELLAISEPVKGRMMHSVDGVLTYTAYGSESECNYSISRKELNKHLLTRAEKAGAKCVFEHRVMDLELKEDGMVNVTFELADKTSLTATCRHLIGCDGGGSAVRYALKKHVGVDFKEDLLEHVYKEMYFPASSDSNYPMQRDALHIWPRGDHMLMGLANLNDGSFTGTIYFNKNLPETTLNTEEKFIEWFKTHYNDAIELLGGEQEVIKKWTGNPNGILGTVWTDNWYFKDSVLLMGDASHAIVPFFGQGCNSGFEDCLYFYKLIEENNQSLKGNVFESFFKQRKPATDAIATMALENFVEMRDKVGDKNFILRKRVEAYLMKEFPKQFRSRYPMVVYSSIPYNQVLEIGKVIDEIVDELLKAENILKAQDVDLNMARSLIEKKYRTSLEDFNINFDVDMFAK